MNKINKKMFFAFVVILLVGAGTFVTAGIFSANSLNKGLVGHWTLDKKDYNLNTNRVTDKSAYSNYGTNVGATFTTDRMGHSEGAMSFDGVDDYITVPDSRVVSDVSVSVWIKSDDDFYQGVWQIVSDYSRFILGTGSADFRNMCFIVSPDGEGWQYDTCYTVPSGDLFDWHHFVGTRDGSTGQIKIYYDGELKDTENKASGNLPSSDRDMTIAKREVSGSYFDGSLDDVRIYNRVLSSNEIELLYDSYKSAGGASAGNLKKGLILDMPLKSRYTKSETAGSEIMTDRTPYSNDGQNYGATIGSSSTSFDGGDSVSLGDSLDPDSNSWTTCVWVNWDGDATTENIIYNKESLYELKVNNGYVQYAWQPHWAWDGGTTCPISANEWKHVCVKYDHSKQYLYCNGDLKYSRIQTGNIGTNSNPFCIGARGSSCSSNRFHGNMTNIQIWDWALSVKEIELLYARGRY